MKPKLSQDEIIAHMKDGWELGWSSGTRSDGRFWIQQGGLCMGGESFNLHANTVRALIKKGLVKAVPRQKGEPYWLRRYVLVSVTKENS